jgi:hypothetical protein
MRFMLAFALVAFASVSLAYAEEGGSVQFTADCPHLEYPVLNTRHVNWNGQSLDGLVTQTSASEFTISYTCEPVECLYFPDGQHLFNPTYGIYLRSAGNQAYALDSIQRNDPNVIRTGIAGKQAAIEAAEQLVSQGVCAKSGAMPNPVNL